MPAIFVSYRRQDSAGHAGRLFDGLKEHFGDQTVFWDVSGSIEPGEQFDKAIERAIVSCDVVLAVIGKQWLNSTDEVGKRRIEDPSDYVRLELAMALRREDVRVIPVLVERAVMPRAENLPEDLQPLAQHHAIELTDSGWTSDVKQLIDTLQRVLGRPKPRREGTEMSHVKTDDLSNTDLPNDICDYIGLIRDEEIRAAIVKNLLLVQEKTDEKRVRQASYELRLSENVEFLVLGDATQGEAIAKYERPANGIGQTLRIEPGQTVKVYTIEIFNLPTNVVAHVFPVGNIYKLGLSPETTYADPGFDGEFYIILCNYSSRVVDLKVGQPIARVEFIKLARSTKKPHPGAKGITEPALWPRRVARRSMDALRKLGVEHLLDELDGKDPPHVEHAFIAREVKRQIAEHQGDLSIKMAGLRRQVAWLHLFGYVAVLIASIWLVGAIWNLLPANIQGKLGDEIVKWIFGLVAVGTPLLFKRVRKTLGLALLGKDS